MTVTNRKDRLIIGFVNWILNHFVSRQYTQTLATVIQMGMTHTKVAVSNYETKLSALDHKLASEPGMDPRTGQTVDPSGNPFPSESNE